MYLIIGCMLVIVIAFYVFWGCRKKKICRKISAMSCEEKCQVLESFIGSFGYCYDPEQDIFSTTIDAPQRSFGYTALYDRYAPRFGMVFDCLPVYFDYRERTWLIEFWKGQYGINLGCEAGVYHADSLVASVWRKKALFHSVDDREMLPMSVWLYRGEKELFHLCRRHWWLTIFRMGCFAAPRELSVRICLNFPDEEMLASFVNALKEQTDVKFCARGLRAEIVFDVCTSCGLPFFRRLFCGFIQWKNRIMCKLFLRVTRPFESALDRALCLYYLLPRALRRIFRGKKRVKCCKKSCGRCKKRCR